MTPATPYDLALPATAYFTGPFFGAQYPVYVRGLAYARLGRHAEAAAAFQSILGHTGLVLNDPIGPAARLQLARASAASGDRAKQQRFTRISWPCGKAPTRTFRSSCKPMPNTRNWTEVGSLSP